MEAEVHKVPLHEVQDLRNLSLRENTFQFVHDKCHGAGWADTYIFSMESDIVGVRQLVHPGAKAGGISFKKSSCRKMQYKQPRFKGDIAKSRNESLRSYADW